MFLRGHMQNAYVTHDLDKAMEIIGNQYGMEPFQRIDPVLTIKTPRGNQPMPYIVSPTFFLTNANQGSKKRKNFSTRQPNQRAVI